MEWIIKCALNDTFICAPQVLELFDLLCFDIISYYSLFIALSIEAKYNHLADSDKNTIP